MTVRIFTKIFCLFLLLLPRHVIAHPHGYSMELSSPAFKNQTSIPLLYAAQGEGVSPPLQWKNFPQDTASFVLMCEDPDAPKGTFDHWILYNLPPSLTYLPVNFSSSSAGIKRGLNSAGSKGYFPPKPPSGTHRYIFTVYALDTVLDLPDGARKRDLLHAMQGHVLDQASLIGLCSKKKQPS